MKLIFCYTILICLAVVLLPTYSKGAVDYYEWEVTEVLDGDTIRVDAPFLPKELVLTVRVAGVDTPEKGGRAKCPEENALSLKATEHTKNLIYTAISAEKRILFYNIKWDKFGGRVLADVDVGGINLAKSLIQNKLGRPYHGEKKVSWCD